MKCCCCLARPGVTKLSMFLDRGPWISKESSKAGTFQLPNGTLKIFQECHSHSASASTDAPFDESGMERGQPSRVGASAQFKLPLHGLSVPPSIQTCRCPAVALLANSLKSPGWQAGPAARCFRFVIVLHHEVPACQETECGKFTRNFMQSVTSRGPTAALQGCAARAGPADNNPGTGTSRRGSGSSSGQAQAPQLARPGG